MVIKYNLFKGPCVRLYTDGQLPNGVRCMLLVNESNDLGWKQDVSLRCFRRVLCLLNEDGIVF